MEKIVFSFMENVKKSETRVCTREDFDRVIDSAIVADTVGRIGKCEDKERRAYLKLLLPAFCFHASFPDGKRRNDGAVPSGLALFDLDHLGEDVCDVWQRIESGLQHEGCRWKVYLVHKTPSGQGLRLVVRLLDGVDVRECQRMFCAEFGLVNDPAVKDLARCSFAVPRDYFYRIDYSVFEDDAPVPPQGGSGVTIGEMMDECEADGLMFDYLFTTESSPADEERLVFDGIPYAAIVERLCERLGCTSIKTGVRNPTLFRLAMLLRNVCDYNPRLLSLVLPRTNPPLSDDEVYSISLNACRQKMDVKMPRILNEVISLLHKERESAVDDTSADVAQPTVCMPRLPKIFRTFAGLCPPEYAENVALSLLPVLGTLGTGISGMYNGNEPQRMNFQAILVGPQSGCKSRIVSLVTDYLLAPLREVENEFRAKEMEYRQAMAAGRNKKRGRKKDGQAEVEAAPRYVIKLLPATVSISRLLERMHNAGGQHLLSVETEINTVANSNRSGTWANKLEIYKNAFDNELYGQDYRSEDSYSVIVPVSYNYLFAGTIEAVSISTTRMRC